MSEGEGMELAEGFCGARGPGAGDVSPAPQACRGPCPDGEAPMRPVQEAERTCCSVLWMRPWYSRRRAVARRSTRSAWLWLPGLCMGVDMWDGSGSDQRPPEGLLLFVCMRCCKYNA